MGWIKIIIVLLLCSFFSGAEAKEKKNSAYQNYTKGAELASHKKYAESVERFEKSIEANPNFLASYIECARSLVMLGKREQAMKKLESAAKAIHRREELDKISKERTLLAELFYTNTTFQFYQNGLNSLRLERSNVAQESLEKALALEPDNVAILLAYARVLQSEDNPKDGIKALEKALEMNPDKKETRVLLAETLLNSFTSRSLDLVKNMAKEKSAEEPEAIVYARALSLSEKNKQAIDFLQDKLDKNSNWVLGLFWLGRFYSQEPQGNWMARKYLMTFLKRVEIRPVPKATKAEAEALLLRVNQALQ